MVAKAASKHQVPAVAQPAVIELNATLHAQIEKCVRAIGSFTLQQQQTARQYAELHKEVQGVAAGVQSLIDRAPSSVLAVPSSSPSGRQVDLLSSMAHPMQAIIYSSGFKKCRAQHPLHCMCSMFSATTTAFVSLLCLHCVLFGNGIPYRSCLTDRAAGFIEC